MIDTHVHFWNYHPVKDAWIGENMKMLQRNFQPDDLQPLLQENGVNACVAVQADQSETETDFLLAYARQYTFIEGVVGWVDLSAYTLPERLLHYSQEPLLKGWRHIVQAEPAGFMDSSAFRRGIAQLEVYGHTYDVLVHQGQLQEATRLVTNFPNQQFVLDHIAKPVLGDKHLSASWKKEIIALAKNENCYCKLSGLVTEANWQQWKTDDFTFYLDAVFEAFGAHRLMFGSDWPVCTLAANYQQVSTLITDYLAQFSATEREQILTTNAINFYQL
jgi:L-fuconolactonase